MFHILWFTLLFIANSSFREVKSIAQRHTAGKVGLEFEFYISRYPYIQNPCFWDLATLFIEGSF